MNPIRLSSFRPSPIVPPAPVGGATETEQSGQGAGAFRSILADSIQQVQNSGDFASKTVEQFLSGENQDLHQVAIATQKAELTFEFFLQARNKVVAAYQEVMRMQL